jgi:hypothetical protein
MARMVTYECDECGCEIVVTEMPETELNPIYCCGMEVAEVSSSSGKPARKTVKKATKKVAKKVTKKVVKKKVAAKKKPGAKKTAKKSR